MKRLMSIRAGIFILMIMPGSPREELGSGAQLTKSPKESLSSSLKTDADYVKMPVYFIANQGQLDKQVACYVQGKGKTI